MADTTVQANVFDDVSRLFKGYFILYEDQSDDSDGYVFNQIVELSASANQLTSPHYGTFGKKKLAAIGYESVYTVRVDDTADLYPTDDFVEDGAAAPDADKISVSYFLDKLTDNELIPARFATVQEADGPDANRFIIHEFEGFITGSAPARNTGTGTWEREYEFEVIDIIKSIREADPGTTGRYAKRAA